MQSTDAILVILKVQPVNFYAIFSLISNISLNIHETKNKRNSKSHYGGGGVRGSVRGWGVRVDVNEDFIPCFLTLSQLAAEI